MRKKRNHPEVVVRCRCCCAALPCTRPGTSPRCSACDPFSIPEGGDVYNAFTKYGFAWGGNAWHSKRDYMHFSYFGK